MIKTIDACIAPIVQALNDTGLATRACCCGHGEHPGVISLMDGREVLIARTYEEAREAEEERHLEIYMYKCHLDFKQKVIEKILVDNPALVEAAVGMV